MKNQRGSQSTANYQIMVQGKIPTFRQTWFDGLSIRYDEEGNSLLVGERLDQSALHGVLEKIRDLGLTLLSVNKIDRVS